jgi:hypothetical protein
MKTESALQPVRLKRKGDLAELVVAAGLRLIRPDRLERVQVKYVESDGTVIRVKCFSHSLTNGRVRKTKHYTAATIDLLAVYDATSDRCFYVPADRLRSGRSSIHLRLRPALNNRRVGIWSAEDFDDP